MRPSKDWTPGSNQQNQERDSPREDTGGDNEQRRTKPLEAQWMI